MNLSARKVILVGFIVLLLVPSSALALNESTHELINGQAASVSRLDLTLKNRLGFPSGLRETFNGATALRWLELGGSHEDEGSSVDAILGKARYLRHFHDPVAQSWDTGGLEFGNQFVSSARWMQQVDQNTEAPETGNWGWPRARMEVVTALTASSLATREQAWANTFRALGQVMHLVVDASVPEHTRNDAHPLESILRKFGARGYHGSYEYWVSDAHEKGVSPAERAASEQAFIAKYLSCLVRCPIMPDSGIFAEPTGDAVAKVRIARLIDTKRYREPIPT